MADETHDDDDNLNPYYGKVISFVDESGMMSSERPTKPFKLLINLGELDDVKVNEKVLVFALGPEVFDLDTKESLGSFEVVRGEGKIASVQKKMAVVVSTRSIVEMRPRRNLNALAAIGSFSSEYEPVNVSAPFLTPEIGDLIRFI